MPAWTTRTPYEHGFRPVTLLPKSSPLLLLWELMRGFRGTYAWAIAELSVYTVINYVTPLVAGATIDFALPISGGSPLTLLSRVSRQPECRGLLFYPAHIRVGCSSRKILLGENLAQSIFLLGFSSREAVWPRRLALLWREASSHLRG